MHFWTESYTFNFCSFGKQYKNEGDHHGKFCTFVFMNKKGEVIARTYPSPLRYPGGKSSLTQLFTDVIQENEIRNGTYCEAYAGGAGAALKLLFDNKVEQIILNDADYHIYAFWKAILAHSNAMINRLDNCNISIYEWYKQKKVYDNPSKFNLVDVGFATFYLNRCNRGGILPNAGPIGGYEQKSEYLINARFNKNNLRPRFREIAMHRSKIQLYNLDAIQFLNEIVVKLDSNNTLLYLDPPYYSQGKNLYLNHYKDKDHAKVANWLSEFGSYKWILSYDNCNEIKELYKRFRISPFDLNYSIQKVRTGKEIMIFSDRVIMPNKLRIGKWAKQQT